MKRDHKFGLLAALVLTQCLSGVQFADADAIYTYTGNNFTMVTSPYTTSDKVTGSITLSTALPDNFNGLVTPESFTFTDGHQTITGPEMHNSSFSFRTDGSGNMIGWFIILFHISGFPPFPTGLIESESIPAGGGDQGQLLLLEASGFNQDPGAWVRAITPVPAPIAGAGLPGLIFAAGAMLAWWRRKRNAQASAA
jgi:hypothetical protein